MKAHYKDGVSYLNGQPMPQVLIWSILRAKKIKQIRAEGNA